jgi:hypothetical protein
VTMSLSRVNDVIAKSVIVNEQDQPQRRLQAAEYAAGFFGSATFFVLLVFLIWFFFPRLMSTAGEALDAGSAAAARSARLLPEGVHGPGLFKHIGHGADYVYGGIIRWPFKKLAKTMTGDHSSTELM